MLLPAPAFARRHCRRSMMVRMRAPIFGPALAPGMRNRVILLVGKMRAMNVHRGREMVADEQAQFLLHLWLGKMRADIDALRLPWIVGITHLDLAHRLGRPDQILDWIVEVLARIERLREALDAKLVELLLLG